jgi:hypothetical protein
VSAFGETLFGGSAFGRWTLTPFVLLCAIVMPLAMRDLTIGQLALAILIELALLSLLAGLWLPPKMGRLAFRVLSGLVFAAYAAYLIYEFFFSGKAIAVPGSRAEAAPINALLGFLVIGVPAFKFAVFGRFAFRPRRNR